MDKQPGNTGGQSGGSRSVDDAGSGGEVYHPSHLHLRSSYYMYSGGQGTPTSNPPPAGQDDRGNKRPNQEYTSPGDTRQQRRQRVEEPVPVPADLDPQARFARISAAARAQVLKEQREKLKKKLECSRKGPGVQTHKTKIVTHADNLFNLPLTNPNSPDINYGHRKWPLALSSPDDLIDNVMSYMWNEHYNWKDDKLHVARCRRLIDEFQRTGLPQTVHADLQDELETNLLAPGAQNIAFRCPCWEDCLGPNWFNHSDASLIETIGPGWGMENQHLFIHLLTRLLIGMTYRYMKDSPEYMDNNTPRIDVPNPKRKRDWWPDSCKAIFEKIRQIKGSNPGTSGYNRTIAGQGYRLIGNLTALPRREILDKMTYIRRYKGDNRPASEGGADEPAPYVPPTRGGLKPPDPTRPTSQREKQVATVAASGRQPPSYFTTAERTFWETYLLTERMIDPKFRQAQIDREKIKEFMILTKKEHDEKMFKTKLKTLTDKVMYNSAKNHKSLRLAAQAVRAYNQLAQSNEAPLYDPLHPERNNKEWCVSAAKLVITVEMTRLGKVVTGDLPPTDYDAREQAALNEQQVQESLAEVTETIQMNVAIERSLGDQQPPAVAQQQGIDSDEEFERMLREGARQSRQTLAAQHGRQVDEPVAFRVPAPRQPIHQGRDTERRKGPASASSTSDSESDGVVEGVGSSHPPGQGRPSSPAPVGTSHQQGHADANLMESEPVLRGLFVGPNSAASVAEGLLDVCLNSQDEGMQNSMEVQSFMDLLRTPSPVRSCHRPDQIGTCAGA
ncbi:hypothetical protein R1sor_016046 [Riccia sorocarpa]|uniref:Uncharacterized protein n=1 Tax=Riccia sorocarpa TaxID=122646 RepID=A0ABD3HGM9_9MARC